MALPVPTPFPSSGVSPNKPLAPLILSAFASQDIPTALVPVRCTCPRAAGIQELSNIWSESSTNTPLRAPVFTDASSRSNSPCRRKAFAYSLNKHILDVYAAQFSTRTKSAQILLLGSSCSIGKQIDTEIKKFKPFLLKHSWPRSTERDALELGLKQD